MAYPGTRFGNLLATCATSAVSLFNLYVKIILIGKVQDLLVELSNWDFLPEMVPPQRHIPLDANVLGTIGTVLWCIQLIPQIWQNWRRKSTEGVPASMLILWAICGPPFGVYAIVQNFNIPVQVQPQCFTLLTIVTWSQTLVYGKRWPAWKAAIAGVGLAALLGGIEVMLVLLLRVCSMHEHLSQGKKLIMFSQSAYRRGITWPIIFIGVLALLLQAAGLIPLYVDMLKRRGCVVGISELYQVSFFSPSTPLVLFSRLHRWPSRSSLTLLEPLFISQSSSARRSFSFPI